MAVYTQGAVVALLWHDIFIRLNYYSTHMRKIDAIISDNVAVLGDHKVDMQTAVNAGVLDRIGITHGLMMIKHCF